MSAGRVTAAANYLMECHRVQSFRTGMQHQQAPCGLEPRGCSRVRAECGSNNATSCWPSIVQARIRIKSAPSRFQTDGYAALIGGNLDGNQIGGAWVFTRTADSWRQQGPKLVGSGAAGAAQQGSCVALSAAIVGGPFDDGLVGAVWVFVRSENVWRQQGKKLVGGNAA
jgi:hypothetical protein